MASEGPSGLENAQVMRIDTHLRNRRLTGTVGDFESLDLESLDSEAMREKVRDMGMLLWLVWAF
jgi:hypothetical protein